MSTPLDDPADYREPPAPTRQVPLRFIVHNFGAYCYNTLRCSVIYNNHDFTILDNDKPSRSPRPDEKENWAADTLGIRNFPPSAQVKWTAKDGSTHEAKVDIGAIFKDGLIWHNVPKADMADFYRGPYASDPGILIVVDDRTVSVYTRTFIPTLTEQIPGNKYSYGRDDLLLAWSHTY
ncbi:MAG TPA: hypothetical protein VF472_16955 [Burkholderiaceae bacterium]